MKQKAFAVRDGKTELFHLPFFSNTHADAERSFSATANNPQTTINQFPEDFALWHIGEYDQSIGKMFPLDQPIHMLNALAIVKKDMSQKQTENTAH